MGFGAGLAVVQCLVDLECVLLLHYVLFIISLVLCGALVADAFAVIAVAVDRWCFMLTRYTSLFSFRSACTTTLTGCRAGSDWKRLKKGF